MNSYLRGLFNSIRNLVKENYNPHSILLHEPTFGAREIYEATKVMISKKITMSELVNKFENQFKNYVGTGYATMVNSGSSANLIAFSALTNPWIGKLKAGDEVIVPAVSWSTTVFPVIQHGLVPVIVDVELDTMNIDPIQLEKAIGKKTKGVILVHTYGNPCRMDEIMRIVKKYGLVLIEDCCEALGAKYGGVYTGKFGVIGTYSFYFSHHITTFEGGMCITDDRRIAEIINILRSHGWIRNLDNKMKYIRKYPHIHPNFLFVNLGYNLRPTELQAAVGSIQLHKLKKFVEIRRENAAYWKHEFKKFEKYFITQSETEGAYSSWFGFPVIVKENSGIKVKELIEFLKRNGIEARPIVAGNIALQPFIKMFKHRISGDLKNATKIMRYGFAFGNHQGIDEKKREYVVGVFRSFIKYRCGL